MSDEWEGWARSKPEESRYGSNRTDTPSPGAAMTPRWHVRLDPDPLMFKWAKWEVRMRVHTYRGVTEWQWIDSFASMRQAHLFLDRIYDAWMADVI